MRFARTGGGVEREQFFQQHANRQRVADRVVHPQEHGGPPLIKTKQLDADERPAREIEGRGGTLPQAIDRRLDGFLLAARCL